jgi:hypothetical protein
MNGPFKPGEDRADSFAKLEIIVTKPGGVANPGRGIVLHIASLQLISRLNKCGGGLRTLQSQQQTLWQSWKQSAANYVGLLCTLGD